MLSFSSSELYLLGYDTPLKWIDTGSKNWGVSAEIPKGMLHDLSKRPGNYAWVLKFKYDKNNEFGDWDIVNRMVAHRKLEKGELVRFLHLGKLTHRD